MKIKLFYIGFLALELPLLTHCQRSEPLQTPMMFSQNETQRSLASFPAIEAKEDDEEPDEASKPPKKLRHSQ